MKLDSILTSSEIWDQATYPELAKPHWKFRDLEM